MTHRTRPLDNKLAENQAAPRLGYGRHEEGVRSQEIADSFEAAYLRLQPDVREAIAALEKRWKYHCLGAELSSQNHYEGAGRPKKGQAPSHVTWRVSGELVEDQEAIAVSQQGRGLWARPEKGGSLQGPPCPS